MFRNWELNLTVFIFSKSKMQINLEDKLFFYDYIKCSILKTRGKLRKLYSKQYYSLKFKILLKLRLQNQIGLKSLFSNTYSNI